MNRHSSAVPMRAVLRALLAALALASALFAGQARAQAPANPFDYERASSFTYKANGLLETETVEPDKPALCVTTTYSYDDYGNKTGARTAPCAASSGSALFAPRESRTEYEAAQGQDLSANGGTSKVNIPRGQFATTVYNALEHKEQREVDPRFGTVLKLTGPNGLATKVQLDDFGRAIQELRADGTSTHTHYCMIAGRNNIATGSNSPACAQHSLAGGEVRDYAVQYVQSEPHDKAGQKMGPFTRVYTDRLGRKIREVSESFDGRLVVRDTQYNRYGAAVLTTQPYFLTSGSSTTTGRADVGMTQTTYDALGRAVRVDVTDPAGRAGSVWFDERGHRNASSTLLQHSGLITTTTDDLGHTRKEEKNVEGKLVRVTDATDAQVAYQHDAFGNLVQTQDALQNLLKVTYDTRGRKLSVDDPDTGLWTYCYNALGELRAQQSPNQRGSTAANALPAQACPATDDSTTTAVTVPGWTTLAYDKLGRLVDRQEPEYRSSWNYDRYADGTECAKGTGKLCESSTTHGVRRLHQYDNLGRPDASRTTVAGGPSFANALHYDENTGRLSGRSYPTGLALSYAYTERGYLSQVKLATAATINPRPAAAGGTPGASVAWAAGKVLWQAGTYNAWGSAESETLGNDVVTRATFDAATGRVTEASAGKGAATDVLSHLYVWDSAGNLSLRGDGNGDGNTGAVSESFQYDSLNRLTQYSVDAPQVPTLGRRTVDLVYNAIGNVLRKSDVGNYEYPAFGSEGNVTRPRPHAVTRVQGSVQRSYTYDANGNVTSAGGSKYAQISYTSFNLPGSQAGITGGGTSYAWRYDENHQRLQETRSNASGTRTTWYQHPDNAGGLAFESEEAPGGAVNNRHYVSAGSQTLVLVSTGALPELAPTARKPPMIGSITLVKVEYWHKDHLGSLAATTDHTGHVTARYAYDPFGKRRETNGRYDENGNQVIDWTSDTDHGTDRGFTGHEHLDDIGLIHMNGRLFDPLIGRFLQGDPMIQAPEELQNYNRYSYCLNNPLNCTDPTGYWSLKKWLKATVKAWLIPTPKNLINAIAEQPGQAIIDKAILRNQFLYQVGMIVVTYYSGGNPYATAAYAAYYGARRTGSVNAGLKAGAIAYISAEMSTWAGDMASYGPTAHYAAHMVSGCVQAEMQGGKCGQGALSSAFTLAATPTVAKYSGGNAILGAMGAAVVGGTASAIGGGKFSNGAQTGAFSYIFNHCGHNACTEDDGDLSSPEGNRQTLSNTAGDEAGLAANGALLAVAGGGGAFAGLRAAWAGVATFFPGVTAAPRALAATDLGLVGTVTELNGTISVVGAELRLTVNMIAGRFSTTMAQGTAALSALATSVGATTISIQATLANPALARALQMQGWKVTAGTVAPYTDTISRTVK